MRIALVYAVLLAATSPRQGCGNGAATRSAAYDPCAGKACGESCAACPPDARDCVETAVVKACDPAGRCDAARPGMCSDAVAACAGRACGDACTISAPCRLSNPPCMLPDQLGHCDVTGTCQPGEPGPCTPHPDCVGKACGASCNPCLPDRVCPTLIASACDPWGRCAGAVPGLCACAGKACGEACDPCDGMCASPFASACDPSGRCAPVASGATCP